MLPNTLNTNEVKNSAGVEVEFSRLSTVDRGTVFSKVLETPSQPHRLSINHEETGIGMKLRRRSRIRFDKTIISDVDNLTPVTCSGYVVLDSPVGAIKTLAEPTNVLANIQSFLSTTGLANVVLFDGTGNGSQALLNGSL